MRVKFIGVEPKVVPAAPRDGWYMISVDPGSTVATVLGRFGLKGGALSVMKNGSLTDIEEVVDDQDDLQILLRSLGG
jgi:hypothetical protein